MDERVMRRHVARLSAKGLVARKDSATGKRFPLKSAGKVKDAFGIDLTPLLSSSRGIIESAQAIVEEQEAIRNVRSQALSVRASILRQSQRIGSEILSMVDEAKKLLRRASLTIEAAKIILKDMMRIASSLEQQECPAQEIDVPAAEPEMYHGTIDETAEESAASGQDVRQVEPQKKDTYKISTRQNDTIDAIWERCKHIRDFFPVMPRTQSEFREHIYLSGKMIALSERCMARGISTLGWSRMLEVLNYLIGNIARIKSPEAYLTAVIGRETAMKKAQDLAPA
jgi:replication initiation protein RepC